MIGLAVGLAAAMALATPSTPGAATLDRIISDPAIAESSGLAASVRHDGLLWTVNDSGDDALVYGVDADGTTVARLALQDAAGGPLDVRDVEAIAATTLPDGRPGLVIADTGDNNGVRERVWLHLIPEPETLGGNGSEPVEVTVTSRKLTHSGGAVDVEALLIDPRDGTTLLVTKTLLGGQVLRVPPGQGDAVTEPVAGVGQSTVTDGVVLPDGRIVLRDYLGAVLYAPFAPGQRQLRRIAALAAPSQPQSESVAVLPDGSAVLTGSEGTDSEVWRVPVPATAAGDQTAPPATSTPVPPITEDGPGEVDLVSGLPGGSWLGAAGLVALVVVGISAIGARRHRRTL